LTRQELADPALRAHDLTTSGEVVVLVTFRQTAIPSREQAADEECRHIRDLAWTVRGFGKEGRHFGRD
jgi:hypothetical protein